MFLSSLLSASMIFQTTSKRKVMWTVCPRLGPHKSRKMENLSSVPHPTPLLVPCINLFCSALPRPLMPTYHSGFLSLGKIDPISHVPGEHIVFGISQATCSWAEENKLKHANKTTSYAPVPLEIILSTVNLWFKLNVSCVSLWCFF